MAGQSELGITLGKLCSKNEAEALTYDKLRRLV